MNKKRVIVSVTNDLYTDQRVHKVCSTLHANGYDVLLVGRLLPDSKPLASRTYRTHRMPLLFKKGALFYAWFNIRLFFFLLFRKADVFLSNDLDTLLANYLVTRLKHADLVYDSHELYTEVPELTSRPKVRQVWLSIEAYIFPRLHNVYTVNESIAAIYKNKYNVEVGVIRNVSPRWKPEMIQSKADLGLPEDRKLIILQGSGINVDRGAEEAVEAMQWVENALLLIVGAGDVIPALKTRVNSLKLDHKVRFIDRLPYYQMMNYTFHADIGLTLDKDTNPNYKFSLPNKVFDYIHTQTPIISSPIIEIEKVIKKHDVGVVLQAHNSQNIAESINFLINDEKELKRLKRNCIQATQTECWEKEKETLLNYFPPPLASE
jgi:glycosyltransferase involved in cell wall biosynthesis